VERRREERDRRKNRPKLTESLSNHTQYMPFSRRFYPPLVWIWCDHDGQWTQRPIRECRAGNVAWHITHDLVSNWAVP
jgi:hypothetical protein